MDNLGKRIVSFILKWPLLIIILTSFLTLAALLFIPKIKIDNSVDVFFNKKSKSYINFQRWKEQFGSDQVIIAAFRDKDIFTRDNLKLISRLTDEFSSLEYVDKVTSITNVNDIVGSKNDFIVRPLAEDIPVSSRELALLKKRALSNPLYVKNVISPDGTATALIIELENNPSEAGVYKKIVVENARRILKKEFPKDKKYYISGFTAIEYFYAEYMRQDLKKFLPFILIIILVILVLSFRSIAGVALPFLAIVVSLTWTMAFLYFCGFTINNVTAIIPPIMLAIAVADSIHLVSESIYRRRNRVLDAGADKDKAFSYVVKELFVPCLFTSLTTAVGFLSLTVSRIPPVRELGIVVGAGVFFAFIVTFTLLPALIKQFNLFQSVDDRRFSGAEGQTEKILRSKTDMFLGKIGKFDERFRALVLAAVFIISGLAVWGMLKIKAETSVIEYFKKTSPIHRATTFVEKHLSGVHFLNVSLESGSDDHFKQPKALEKIQQLERFLLTVPEVDKVTSVVDYIKEINKAFHNEDEEFYRIPSSKKLVAQYLLLYGASDLDDFVDSRWAWTTVRVRLKEHSTVKLKKVIDKIRDYLASRYPADVRTEVLGQTVLEVETNNAVTRGQVQSLILAMVVIFAMMFFVFRSIPAGFISIVPNVLPLLINFGIMGWVGIRLDSATSMISAIAIGIIVDDTIHFLHCFGEKFKEGKDYAQAIHHTLLLKGRPIILTSVILCFGFGIVTFSKFVPTSYFGLLSTLLIFNALWADLVVLPAVILQVKPKL